MVTFIEQKSRIFSIKQQNLLYTAAETFVVWNLSTFEKQEKNHFN